MSLAEAFISKASATASERSAGFSFKEFSSFPFQLFPSARKAADYHRNHLQHNMRIQTKTIWKRTMITVLFIPHKSYLNTKTIVTDSEPNSIYNTLFPFDSFLI